MPASGDLKFRDAHDPTFPNPKTFGRLGSKLELVTKLAAYCRDRAAYQKVVTLCEEYLSNKGISESHYARSKATLLGFVYLAKSGQFYKIGRTNAAGRREYELGIQLPERIRTVHIIRTDDPVGIEAYWHKRFEAKRGNGEWFALDANDIAAFKSRKSM